MHHPITLSNRAKYVIHIPARVIEVHWTDLAFRKAQTLINSVVLLRHQREAVVATLLDMIVSIQWKSVHLSYILSVRCCTLTRWYI
jgi:hypothetical protein